MPPASPYFGRACLLSATHLINTGRYSPAEKILMEARDHPVVKARYHLERALGRLYRFQGRFDEVREIVPRLWAQSPTPAADLRELWTLDHSPMPVEAWRRSLEVADAADDRVWLGNANVAITTGRFDDAGPWLDRCRGKRPDDPAVWQAYLDLAVATADEPGFWIAVAHLPASRFDAAAVKKLRVWLMALRRDAPAEETRAQGSCGSRSRQHQGTRAAGRAPDREGRVKESEELHRRKAEIDRAHDMYRKMINDGEDLSSRAALAAELSAALGAPV